MLSSTDTLLVKRDSTLPGLSTLLDPESFHYALRSVYPHAEVQSAKLVYLRYKFQTSCLAQYEIQVDDTTLSLHAIARRADATDKFRKFQQKTPLPSSPALIRVLLPEKHIAFFPFPDDAELKVLPRIFDAKKRRRLLREMLPEIPALSKASLEDLAYKPERRYVGCLHGDEERAVLRSYAEADFNRAKANTESFFSRSSLRVARQLGYSISHSLLVMEWLPGPLLSELIRDKSFQADRLSLVGAALAELHSQRGEKIAGLNRKDECVRLKSFADDLSNLCPQLSELSQALGKRMASKIEELPQVSQAIHGDFYAKQVLLNEEGVSVLDLDEAVQSDGAADLGNFIAHLERDVLQTTLSRSRLEVFKSAFLSSYADAAGESSFNRIPLYSAVALFRLAMEPFRRHGKHWLAETETLLLRVEAVLNQSVSISVNLNPSQVGGIDPFPVIDPFPITDDPKMHFLAQAINPPCVQSALEFDLAEEQSQFKQCRLKAIRVTRYKPVRRCLIEYDVQLGGDREPSFITLLGKARGKGLHQESYRVQRELWNAGFDDNSADGISVPRPVGKIAQFEMWFQEKVAGQCATDLIAESPSTLSASRIAEGIYKLHNSSLLPRHRHTVSDELRILHERLRVVAEQNPLWHRRLEQVLTACDRLRASIDETMTSGIHRDFYADQVLVSGARLYLLDFDLFCEGNPALDIGNFIAHVSEQSLRSCGDASANAEWEQELVERYLTLSGKNILASIRAYTVLSLVRHISLSSQFQDRRPFTKAILELCEQRLEIKSF